MNWGVAPEYERAFSRWLDGLPVDAEVERVAPEQWEAFDLSRPPGQRKIGTFTYRDGGS